MKTKNKLISNLKFLLTSILGIASFIFIIILTSIIYLVEAEEELNLEKNTFAWANSLAQASVSYLVENPKDTRKKANEKLKELVTPDYINYIHIYKKNDVEVTYFTGFNKSIYYPSIPNKISQLESLSTFKQNKNNIELVVNIENNKEIVGYLYIQSSRKGIDNFSRKLTFLIILLSLFGLSLFLIITYKIKNKLDQVITPIVESIQEISNNKNYNKRIEPLPLIEFDVLAQNINILLNRTEKHLTKKDDTHQQTLLQNTLLAEKVKARTDALKESNQELLSTLEKLHQFQGQLVETEKMASLGDMVAGIAHEINTPVGLGVTASTLLHDRLLEIKNAFEDKSLKSSQLKKFLTQGEENIGIIYRNLNRAANLISSFKKVAVDQSSIDTRAFNFQELLDEVSLTLKGKLEEQHVKLIIDCPENLIIESKAGPINQILINLILNSIIHGFENKPNGEINISVLYLSNQLHINYKDNGIGINESIKAKIFEPFTTTKRGNGGSGLGLHLVFNIVTQALNGHIDFESESGLGTTFNIIFPTHLVSES
jgi:signal transduction histidine kinase